MSVAEWETAWTEYVEALDNNDADWGGEDYVISVGRVARRLNEAKSKIRALDPDFCKRLEI